VDSAGDSVGVDSVARIDSGAFSQAAPQSAPPWSLGTRDSTHDCPVPAGLVLTCPPSEDATHIGSYVVTVSPACYPHAANPDTAGAFQLEVYPP